MSRPSPSRGPTNDPDELTYQRLLEVTGSCGATAGEVQRARIILGCLAGESIQQIASRLAASASTVIRWENRFLAKGLAGLRDRERGRCSNQYGDDFEKVVLKKLEQAPPAGYGQWDGALLARELKVSKDAVWRLLREHRVSLARKCTWCVSTDPDLRPKRLI